jgi:hypothetical protein
LHAYITMAMAHHHYNVLLPEHLYWVSHGLSGTLGLLGLRAQEGTWALGHMGSRAHGLLGSWAGSFRKYFDALWYSGSWAYGHSGSWALMLLGTRAHGLSGTRTLGL